MNIIEQFLQNASINPDHPCIEDIDRTFSYAETEKLARILAGNLQAIGLKPGGVIAFQLRNSAWQCALLIAIGLCGCVLLPVRRDVEQSLAVRNFEALNVKLFITDSPQPAWDSNKTVLFESLLTTQAGSEFQAAPLSDNTPFRISSSSGTTGSARYFVLDHAVSMDGCLGYEEHYGWNPDDRCLITVPMGDSWGCNICLSMMRLGGTLVITPSSEPEQIASDINTRNITVLVLLPWELRLFLKIHSGEYLLFPNVRCLVSSGSKLGIDEKKAIAAKLTPNLIDTYATQELVMIAIGRLETYSSHPDSVGKVLPGTEVEVVDSMHTLLPKGKQGLLRFRRDSMIDGYLDNPAATAERFRDGWFYPMDIGYLDKDNHLFLTGRADDIIDTRGAKYYPIEVERVLQGMDEIEEAVVFGWPDKEMGAVAAAALVSTTPLDQRALVKYCRALLEEYKVPRYFLRLKSIPRIKNGKVDRNALEQRLQALLENQK